ncbi:CHAT domain-containing protein [Streptomyces stramineus]
MAGQTAEDLSRRLLKGCHILHFIGHGSYDTARQEGMISLADQDGREHPLHASALSALLSVARPKPQLVVLNSCQTGMGNADDLFSSTAAVLVRNVPAIIAMQFAVTDKAATRFAASSTRRWRTTAPSTKRSGSGGSPCGSARTTAWSGPPRPLPARRQRPPLRPDPPGRTPPTRR